MIEDSCFYRSFQAEAVTIAILNYVSLPSLCCLMNKIVTTFKQTVFLPEQCEVAKVKSVRVLPFSLDTDPQSFCHHLLACQ